MKKLMALILAAVMCFSLAACGSSDAGKTTTAAAGEKETSAAGDTTAAAADTTAAGDTASGKAIRIGGTAPLTGGAAVYGIAVKRGAEIAVEEVNAKGGLQFELKYEDDVHDAEKAVNAYNSVKDWGMQISLGSVTSAPGLATSPMNFADRIFALTPSASTDGYPVDKDNVYQMCFADSNQGSASAQYIADKKLGTKIAVIYQNDIDYSAGIFETFEAKAAELNLDIVSTSTFITDATDFSVQIADAKNSGADLLFLPIYYKEASLILAQCKTAGYEPTFFGVDGMDGILTMDGFDTSLAEGVMLLTPFSADAKDDLTVNFVTKYQSKYNEIPNQFAADAYDAVYALYQACTAAGVTADMSRDEICTKLIEEFNKMTFSGLTGENMTWKDGYVTKTPKGMVIKDGAYVGLD